MQSRASLIVDSNLLAENLALLKSITVGKEIIPMVKADGYGHGAVGIARVLVQNGIKVLGVATIVEALVLRRELSDYQFEILIFSDVQLDDTSNHSLYCDFRLTPVVSNFDDLKIFLSAPCFRSFPLMIKFNTGMNRLGLSYQEVDTIAAMILAHGRKTITHALSHFACASQNIKLNNNDRQHDRYVNLLAELRARGLAIEETSLSNSGAIEQGAGLEFSHVRPGLMMYGPSSLVPGLESKWRGKIISSLRVRVLHTGIMKKGDPVGYGATPLGKDGLLVIAAIGYGDGFNNRYQKAKFDIKTQNGAIYPVDVVGRVNMDMVQLLAPVDAKISAGSEIIFWDDEMHSLEQLCHSSKTIPYEVFCQLSGRVPRIFTLA